VYFREFRVKKSFFKDRLLSLCESQEIFAKVTRAADVIGNVQAFLGIHGEVNNLFALKNVFN